MGCFRDYCTPWFASLTYSRSLYDLVMDKTRDATKPIVLIYGLDDTWTGADLPEELVEDTILHEMIHYYIAFNQWRDTSTHGQLFRREMKRINEKGGRHISISYRPNPEQLAQLRAKN